MSTEVVSNASPAGGVYYARADCAGFWRRVLVDFVDFTLVWAAIGVVLASVTPRLPSNDLSLTLLFVGSSAALGFLYLVALMRSPFRTLGCRLAGVRVVDLKGADPGFGALALRACFLYLGPINVLIDLAWGIGDRRAQALRDKLTQTYVIKSRAVPAGRGPIKHMTYDLSGPNFVFTEVSPTEVRTDGRQRPAEGEAGSPPAARA